MKKYKREELSRILGMSAVGLLGSPTSIEEFITHGYASACIEQCALASWENTLGGIQKEGGDSERARTFDNYRSQNGYADTAAEFGHPDTVLKLLEAWGLA